MQTIMRPPVNPQKRVCGILMSNLRPQFIFCFRYSALLSAHPSYSYCSFKIKWIFPQVILSHSNCKRHPDDFETESYDRFCKCKNIMQEYTEISDTINRRMNRNERRSLSSSSWNFTNECRSHFCITQIWIPSPYRCYEVLMLSWELIPSPQMVIDSTPRPLTADPRASFLFSSRDIWTFPLQFSEALKSRLKKLVDPSRNKSCLRPPRGDVLPQGPEMSLCPSALCSW